MTEATEWDYWASALAGIIIDVPKHVCAPGFYRQRNDAIAFWRGAGGQLKCTINDKEVYRTEVELAESVFSWCCKYPIPEDVYRDVAERGKPWPPEYLVNLSLKEAQAGEVWTVEKAREKLARQNGLHAPGAVHGPTKAERAAAAAIVEPDAAENDRAVIGSNAPPEPIELDTSLAVRIEALEKQASDWLAGIGGKPRDQIECDKVANYRELFLKMEKEAGAKHETEKAPHLAAGKAVDAKWLPLERDAKKLKEQLAAIADVWLKAEKARLAELTRLENEKRAAEVAAENARRDALRVSLAASPSAPAVMPDLAPVTYKPVEAPKVTAGTMGRAVGVRAEPMVYRIDNIGKVAAYLAGLSIDSGAYRTFFEGCQKAVNAIGKSGKSMPGVNEPKSQEQAA